VNSDAVGLDDLDVECVLLTVSVLDELETLLGVGVGTIDEGTVAGGDVANVVGAARGIILGIHARRKGLAVLAATINKNERLRADALTLGVANLTTRALDGSAQVGLAISTGVGTFADALIEGSLAARDALGARRAGKGGASNALAEIDELLASVTGPGEVAGATRHRDVNGGLNGVGVRDADALVGVGDVGGSITSENGSGDANLARTALDIARTVSLDGHANLLTGGELSARMGRSEVGTQMALGSRH
jgi:hypothetical protein